MAISYGNVYVATVAMGAKDEHTLRAFLEAEAYEGPSLIIAYSHCIAHGYDLKYGLQVQKLAVDTGQWLLYRYNPERLKQGQNPLIIDSMPPKKKPDEYFLMQSRFKILMQSRPEEAKQLFQLAEQDSLLRRKLYELLSEFHAVGEPVGASS